MTQSRPEQKTPSRPDPSGKDLLQTMLRFRRLVKERQTSAPNSRRRIEIDRQLDVLRSMIWGRAFPEHSSNG